MSTAVAVVHKAEILRRVEDGEKLADIAASFNVTHPAISRYLANDPDYIAAKEAGAEARLDAREAELEAVDDAASAVTLARARELLSHQRWRCEREFSHRWGAKQQNTNINIDGGDWSDRLRRARGRTIEAETQRNNAELVTDNRHNQAQAIDSKEIAASQRDFT